MHIHSTLHQIEELQWQFVLSLIFTVTTVNPVQTSQWFHSFRLVLLFMTSTEYCLVQSWASYFSLYKPGCSSPVPLHQSLSLQTLLGRSLDMFAFVAKRTSRERNIGTRRGMYKHVQIAHICAISAMANITGRRLDCVINSAGENPNQTIHVMNAAMATSRASL